MGRRILVISYFVNEDGMACAHHVTDRLMVLAGRCEALCVLSSWCVRPLPGLCHRRTPSLMPSGLRFETRRRFHRLVSRNRAWKAVRDLTLFPLLPLYAAERAFSRLDPTWHWQPLAVRSGLGLIRRLGMDTVYSTGGPPVAHTVARAIAEREDVKWLAEIQDPLIHGYCAGHEDEYRKLVHTEKAIYRDADRMIFLTRAAREATEKRVGMSGKGEVIYPGAPPLTLPEAGGQRNGILRLAHFGSLGGVRNLAPLLAGLQWAATREPGLVRELQIDLYGGIGGDDRQRLADSPLGSLFRLHGLVPREQALQAMAASDILLLIQGIHDISRETIPSKCYEYFHSGRPILGLIHENSELTSMFEKLGHRPVAAADPEAIGRGVLELRAAFRAGQRSKPSPSPYTVQAAVDRLLEL